MALDVTGSHRYPNPNAAWLAQHVEEIIEPDIEVVDPHHHIWNQPGNPYSIEDLSADVLTGHKVLATVFVQAHHGYRCTGPEALRCVGETEQIEAAAKEAQKKRAVRSTPVRLSSVLPTSCWALESATYWTRTGLHRLRVFGVSDTASRATRISPTALSCARPPRTCLRNPVSEPVWSRWPNTA